MYIEGVKDGRRFLDVAEGGREEEAGRRLEGRHDRRRRARGLLAHGLAGDARRRSGTRRCARRA